MLVPCGIILAEGEEEEEEEEEEDEEWRGAGTAGRGGVDPGREDDRCFSVFVQCCNCIFVCTPLFAYKVIREILFSLLILAFCYDS